MYTYRAKQQSGCVGYFSFDCCIFKFSLQICCEKEGITKKTYPKSKGPWKFLTQVTQMDVALAVFQAESLAEPLAWTQSYYPPCLLCPPSLCTLQLNRERTFPPSTTARRGCHRWAAAGCFPCRKGQAEHSTSQARLGLEGAAWTRLGVGQGADTKAGGLVSLSSLHNQLFYTASWQLVMMSKLKLISKLLLGTIVRLSFRKLSKQVLNFKQMPKSQWTQEDLYTCFSALQGRDGPQQAVCHIPVVPTSRWLILFQAEVPAPSRLRDHSPTNQVFISVHILLFCKLAWPCRQLFC